jgi:hypothetical protein
LSYTISNNENNLYIIWQNRRFMNFHWILSKSMPGGGVCTSRLVSVRKHDESEESFDPREAAWFGANVDAGKPWAL